MQALFTCKVVIIQLTSWDMTKFESIVCYLFWVSTCKQSEVKSIGRADAVQHCMAVYYYLA